MKTSRLIAVFAGLLSFFNGTAPLFAAATVSVDMDLATPGIQSTRVAAPGETFTVGLVLTVDASGVSSYGISAQFDTAELMLNGSPAASVPALPGGLSPLAAPVENNALGRVNSFNGATLGLGPASTSFLIGTINFQVVVPLNDGLPDITLGFFNGGVDGFFDNNGNPITPTFNSGSVVITAGNPPIITCPSNVVAECTGGLTPVNYTVSAVDPEDGPVPVTCVPPSGSGFRLGSSNVTCTATDSAGNVSSCRFIVSVVDTTPPRVTCPGDMTVRTITTNAVAVYSAGAFDLCGLSAFNCSPPGDIFPLGVTTVVCAASDVSSNVGRCSFTVTVLTDNPPVIACSSNLVAECTGGLTPVNYAVSAQDPEDGPVPVTCVPPSASGFRIGSSNVTCSATDSAGNLSRCSFTVDVVDTTPPRVTCPGDMTVQTTTTNAIAGYSAGAFDLCGLSAFNCSPPGDIFPLGVTTVVCSASDLSSNVGQCTFTVTVLNGNPPVITWPSNLVAECTGGHTPVNYAVSALDPEDGPVPVICVPPSGSDFRLGTSNVTCTATDSVGNSTHCSFTVTVVDTTPPNLLCPTNLSLDATNATGAVVAYGAPPAIDLCSGPVPATCFAAAGSLFPIGTTTVHCTASDAAGNSAACSFQVTVLGPRGIKESVLAELTALRAGVTRPHDRDELDEAISHLARSLASELWVDQTHVTRKHGERVFNEEKDAAHELCELVKDKQSTVSNTILQGFIARIAAADRLLAVVELQEAANAGVNPKKIAEDLKELAKGDQEAARGDCDHGIEHYRNAWQHAAHLQAKLLPHLVNGAVRLEFSALPGQTYVIQASTNLTDWFSVGTGTVGSDGTVVVEDATASQAKMRFYRAVLVP